MKHNWVTVEGREKVMEHGWAPMRRCINCGIVQKKESEQVWMRLQVGSQSWKM